MARRSAHAAKLGFSVLLALVLAPRVAWVSGAMSARAVGASYQLSIAEASYAFGEDPPPSAAVMKAQEDAIVAQLASLVPKVERFLADESAAQGLAPLEIAMDTNLVGPTPPALPGGQLRRPTLVQLARCTLDAANLVVELRVALTTLPSPKERAALTERLCGRLKADANVPPAALVELQPLEVPKGGPRMTLEARVFVPKDRAARVIALRKAFFDRAVATTNASLAKLSKERGLRVVAADRPGPHLVRSFTDLPYGGFDVLLGLEGIRGDETKAEYAVKDGLYADWHQAGLPRAEQLESILRK